MYEITNPITKVAKIMLYDTLMLVAYSVISPDAIKYGHVQGTNGAHFWPYTIKLTNDWPAPPIIAGTMFVISSEMNTNGENVKNNSTFA